MRAVRLATVALAALVLVSGCKPNEKDRVALVGAHVIDGRGGRVLEDAVIIVYQGKIETVTAREGYEIPETAEVIDVSGRWIIPGLIDGHGHVERWALPRYVAQGVTSVRDFHGSPMDSILALSEEANLAGMVAPRVFTAGAALDGGPAESGATEIRSEREARRAVDDRAVGRASYVTTQPRITPELMKAILDEAKVFQLRVGAELGLTDARTAARLGVHVIDRLSGIAEAASPRPAELLAAHRAGGMNAWRAVERSWAGLDSASLAKAARDLAGAGVILVPTLVAHETLSRLDDPAVLLDTALQQVPQVALAGWNVPDFKTRAGWTETDYQSFRRARPMQDLFIREFRAAGGVLAAGSDASSLLLVPGASLHQELELLVNAGLTPKDAIGTATLNGARLLGADSIGVIAAGKVADLVILSADPLADIRNTRRVERVMIRGLIMTPDSIRADW